MALSDLFKWNKNAADASSACGASDKPEETPAACGSACGANDKPEEAPAACGSAAYRLAERFQSLRCTCCLWVCLRSR